jgi:AcrR family transcriptional regulator
MATEQRQLLPREERRASILEAAARAFVHAGYAATSMEDVAAEAGVTKLIVYRHFESKEELYRLVLERISTRLRQEFLRQLNAGDPGFTVRSTLTVAREEPDAVRLLLVHAVREPEFREHALAHRADAIEIANQMIGDSMGDPAFKAWAAETIVSYLGSSVLAWLEHGEPERDDEFVSRATAGLVALYLSFMEGT